MSPTAALSLIDEALDGMRDRPAMYGGPEAVLFQALLALDIRAALLGGGDCRVTYDAMRRERRIPCSMHAHQAVDDLGEFIGDLIRRERLRVDVSVASYAAPQREHMMNTSISLDMSKATAPTALAVILFAQEHGLPYIVRGPEDAPAKVSAPEAPRRGRGRPRRPGRETECDAVLKAVCREGRSADIAKLAGLPLHVTQAALRALREEGLIFASPQGGFRGNVRYGTSQAQADERCRAAWGDRRGM